MPNMKEKLIGAVALTACLTFVGSVRAADSPSGAMAKIEDASGVIKMSELLCKDIMRFSGDDRLAALAILHGYFLGKKGANEYEVGSLSRVSDDFTEYCLDRPAAKALESFEKFVK